PLEPADAPPLAASSIRAAVRLSLKSARVEKTPIRDRSGGMTVRLIQSPLAYSKKLSPGLTERSILATTIPCVSCCGASCANDARSTGPKVQAPTSIRTKIRDSWINIIRSAPKGPLFRNAGPYSRRQTKQEGSTTLRARTDRRSLSYRVAFSNRYMNE